jgi:ClpP class serine protease
MGATATSGGYYVSMAVGDQPQSIYAEPTTTTGSIGVIIPHYNFSGLLGSLGCRRRLDHQPSPQTDAQYDSAPSGRAS